uniref:Uncharacterized protein n=1 Tax=Heterorhabditis bacteriophora TaxID=37862 RepID=A0A1I7WPF9_HETBA
MTPPRRTPTHQWRTLRRMTSNRLTTHPYPLHHTHTLYIEIYCFAWHRLDDDSVYLPQTWVIKPKMTPPRRTPTHQWRTLRRMTSNRLTTHPYPLHHTHTLYIEIYCFAWHRLDDDVQLVQYYF